MKTAVKKKLGTLLTFGLGLILSGSLVGSALLASAYSVTEDSYELDYSTLAQANEAAIELSNEIGAEGSVLLKNKDGALPMAGNEWITTFDGSDDFTSAFESSGFNVYESSTSSVDAFTNNQQKTMKAYNDAAIIFLSGGSSGEGRTDGYVTDEVEDNLDSEGNPYTYEDGEEFTHKSLGTDADGTEYKHTSQVGNDTEELIHYCAENFKKVIILITSDSALEIGILEASDEVDAILWTGDPGSAGWQGLSYGGYDLIGELLNGNISPSGKTTDLWAWDFTANSTWANDGNSGNSYTSAEAEEAYGYTGVSVTKAFRTDDGEYAVRQQHTSSDTVSNYYTVKYEEDIYYGYRYYETADAEAAKGNYEGFEYDHSVVYPFGYGLTYTSFEKEIVDVDDDDWNDSDRMNGGTITLKVKVTNTGSVAAKDVVEVYGHSPYYAGGIAKTENVLVGFEKTSTLNPGASETVSVTVKINDLASFDADDVNGNGTSTYELEAVADTDAAGHEMSDSTGHYELRVQSDSHEVDDTYELDDIGTTFVFDTDAQTGEEVENIYSQDDIYNLTSYDPGTGKDLVEEGKMTVLDRSDFAGTWPEIDTAEDMVRSDEYFAAIDDFADYEADSFDVTSDYYTSYGYDTDAASEDDSDLPWAIDEETFDEEGGNTWSQNDTSTSLEFRDLTGIDWADDENVYQNTDPSADYYTDNAEIAGLTGKEVYDAVINKMSYDEMVELVSYGAYQCLDVESINKPVSRYMDSALVVDQELYEDGVAWGGCPRTAATWNKDIIYRRGVISGNIALLSDASSSMSEGVGLDGWYAPGMDIHRSPFGGRNSEYFSEDAYLTGTTAGLIIEGMQSKGIICTAKHYALNENETQRINLQTYVTEQTARECYFKAFQMVIQDYDCSAVMTSYNCIGDVHSNANYNFMNVMTRGEWGFNGFACTDAVNPTSSFFTMDTLLRTGANLLLSRGVDDDKEFCAVSGEYVEEGETTSAGTTADKTGVYLSDGTYSYTQWYWLRSAVRDLLYTEANSAVASNGIDISTYADQGGALADGTQGVSYSDSVAFSDASQATSVSYEITDGALPDGLSLSSNGTVSGTPTTEGDYTFTVEVTCDGWITGEATFTISIGSAFYLDASSDTLEVGEEYDAYIASDVFTTGTNGNYDTVTYEITSGTLPAGLTFDTEEGYIEGTPTEAGTFEIVITVTASKTTTTSNWQGTVTTTTETVVDYTLTLVVEGETASDSDETATLTAEEVEAMIEEAIAELGTSLTEDEVQALIDSALAGVDSGLTESEVQALIDAALEDAESSGCGSVIGVTGSVIAVLAIAAAAAVVLQKKGRKE